MKKLLLFLIPFLFLIPKTTFGAISATTIWEIRNGTTTANNVNGGGFNTANAAFPADLTTDANTGNTNSPVVSSATYNFVAGDVGAWVYIKSGADWYPDAWYQIASVASNKATLSAAIGQGIVRTAGLFAVSTVAGVASVGTPTSGTYGVDYSQGTTAIDGGTDLATADAAAIPAVITSASHNFIANDVGNIIHITTLSGWTAGWYEIVSVSGNAATLDRACGTTGAKSNGPWKLGGAMSMASTLDDDFFEMNVAGNITFVKNGTYTLGEAIALVKDGNATTPITVIGYNATRGDNPTGNNRPTFVGGASNIIFGDFWSISNMQFTSTGTTGLTLYLKDKINNCKAVNTSNTADRSAIQAINNNTFILNSEMISYYGPGYYTGAFDTILVGNYIHNCKTGIYLDGSKSFIILNNLIESNTVAAIYTTAGAYNHIIAGNTLYGSEAKTGIGINFDTGSLNDYAINNIIYGFVTGFSHTDAQTINIDEYNDFYNNTTDVSNWVKGKTSVAVNPGFTNVAQVTGTTATYVGSTLTDAAADFSNVVDNQDYILIVSGTGLTNAAMSYLITAHTATTVTTDLDAGESSASDWIYQITTGRNFSVGTALKALGFPGAFQAGLTTGYMDIGAVQRVEPTGGGTCSNVFGAL